MATLRHCSPSTERLICIYCMRRRRREEKLTAFFHAASVRESNRWNRWLESGNVGIPQLHVEYNAPKTGGSLEVLQKKRWSWPSTPRFSWSRVPRVESVWQHRAGAELQKRKRISSKHPLNVNVFCMIVMLIRINLSGRQGTCCQIFGRWNCTHRRFYISKRRL